MLTADSSSISRRSLLRRSLATSLGASLGSWLPSAHATDAQIAELTQDPLSESAIARMVGQLLVLGLPAKSVSDESAQILCQQIAQGKVGGTVLLRHNIKDRESLLALAELFVRADPLVLNAIDQEGGLVQRLSTPVGFSVLPRARWVADNFSLLQAEELYFEAGEELRRAGFNVNLAPSVDWHDPENPVIGKHGRSFGSDATVIEDYATSFLRGMRRAGLATTLKHFPGHGTSRGDSHNGFVDISSTWNTEELRPFRRLALQAPLVMGGHLVHPRFSDGDIPVTFSRQALQQELRDQLGFPGAIITDDLDMGAIRDSYSLEDAVVRSLGAGNDLLLMSNSLDYNPLLPDLVVEWVSKALVEQRLAPERLIDAYIRVIDLKKRFGFAWRAIG